MIVFATGSLRYGAVQKLRAIGVNVEDEILVTSSELKTREDIVSRAVTLACEQQNASPAKRVVSISDGTWDLKTPSNLGYDFFGIEYCGNIEILERQGAMVYQDFNSMLLNGLDHFVIGLSRRTGDES